MRRILFVILASLAGWSAACGSTADEGLYGGSGSGGSSGSAGSTGGSSARAGTGGSTGTGGQVSDSSAAGSDGQGGAGGDLEGGAGDAPIEGSVGPTPGSVECRGQKCDLSTVPPSICCLQTMSIFPTMCTPSFPGCPTPGAKAMACDDSSDCRSGEVCCTRRVGGVYTSAGCAATCADVRLCRSVQDCDANQTCDPIPDLPGFSGCR